MPKTNVLGLAAAQINDSTTVGRALLTAAAVSNVLSVLGTGTPGAGNYLRGDGTWSAAATSLTTTAVKTGPYTAGANELVPVDTTGGAVTITLPTAPADKTRVTVKHVIQGSTNSVSVAVGGSDVFNVSGSTTAKTLPLLNQAITLQYNTSTGIWYTVSDDIPLSGLDGRYVASSGTQSYGRALLNTSNQAALFAILGTSGTPSSTTYLRGDGTWATAGSGSGATLNANSFTGQQQITPAVAVTYGLVLNNSAANVSGSSSQGYHLSVPAIINNATVIRPPFTLVSTESLDANNNIDYVVYLGHNFAPTGRVDSAQAAVGIGFEQYWMNQMEHHVSVGIWPDGTMVRGSSVVYPVGTKEPLWYSIGVQHDYYTQTSNAAGRPAFGTLTCTGDGAASTFYIKNYDVATSTNWGVSISMGPSASGLNESVIAANGTGATNGNLQINATGQLKLQQNLINIVGTAGSQLITFNADFKAANNSTGWKSNVTLKTNYNVLLDADGYIGWGNQGSSNWPAVARLIAANGTNNLTLENRATSGVCLWGNQSASNTTGTVQVQNKGVVVLQVNTNNTVTLAGTLTAGGLTTTALQIATAGPLIYSGSGVPTISAAVKGSLYLRNDGSTTSTRLYVATDTVGGWTAVTTAA